MIPKHIQPKKQRKYQKALILAFPLQYSWKNIPALHLPSIVLLDFFLPTLITPCYPHFGKILKLYSHFQALKYFTYFKSAFTSTSNLVFLYFPQARDRIPGRSVELIIFRLCLPPSSLASATQTPRIKTTRLKLPYRKAVLVSLCCQ